jgi:aminoacrylate hydrolase
MPEFARPNATLHYEIAGIGRPLLLVAGTASDSASWGPLLPLLAGRQLIMPDNRGSGRSRAAGSLAIPDMIDDLSALIDHLGIGPLDVVGHSLGGLLGLGLAATYPRQVARLVTLTSGTMSDASRVLFRDLARLYFTMAPTDWFRLLYQWLFSDPFFADEANIAAAASGSTAYAWRQSPGDFARQVAAIDAMPPIDLRRVTCSVLAVAAELDLLAPPKAVLALHSAISGVHHQTIPGAAHSIHWEKPAEVAAAISGFLG